MQFTVKGRQVGFSERLREHVCECLEYAISKYSTATISSHVIVAGATTQIVELAVGEPTMRKALAEWPSLLSLNRSHDGMDMLFHRTNSNIGCFDAQIKTAV